ncbi:hypothetical protein ABOM_001851 [Aspergillus bombycis]|uniref:Lignostilbene dioxygenase n=1 Tax=Aspergillus bombycis TaxID=109264 RepID=A0A1F8ADY9_9EURO|nr:hypothetical protein ABOM_001851 [Aspergillus bombycis]OGM49639.1 hypothetical protein ABOM_001851 [Aspergillus bombycis]
MAHSSLRGEPVYTNGVKVGDRIEFPKTPAFSNFAAPARFEGQIMELEVEGTIPGAVEGTYYHVSMDHRFPPKFQDDILFNGDGCVAAFRISEGHCDWKRRFVQTDRYHVETAARKSLFGRYRNPYTDDESVQGVIRTAANTNVVFWRGVILACKEDGPPFALDPETLETIGRYDFDGQVLAPTFTAHPKIDPKTQSMLTFAYEAGGNGNDGSREIAFYEIDADGRKTEEVWFEAPYCGFIHDFGFTDNFIILPLTPLKMDLDRLKKGGAHWAWDPSEYHYFGIAPRHGAKKEDMVWIRHPNAFQGHVAGHYEKDGKLIFDLTMANGNLFWWFPPEGKDPEPPSARSAVSSPMTRYIFDIKDMYNITEIMPAFQCPTSAEFSRIDDRFLGQYYKNFWVLGIDMARSYDLERCGLTPSGRFNLLVHYNWETAKETIFWPGPTTVFQEPCFVPESDDAPEGEGYLVVVVNRMDVKLNELWIFEAQAIQKGPIAKVKLPLRPGVAFHGNFVDARDIKEFARRRAAGGDLGPATAARQPLPWQTLAGQP